MEPNTKSSGKLGMRQASEGVLGLFKALLKEINDIFGEMDELVSMSNNENDIVYVVIRMSKLAILLIMRCIYLHGGKQGKWPKERKGEER